MMRHYLQALLLVVCTLLARGGIAPAAANESTTHRITSGTFGIAWIASEGLIYVYSPPNGAAPFRVNNVRAHQVAAIDYDADGNDELAIIDALKKSLFVYDFDDETMIGGFGHNVAEMTVGRFGPNEPFESLVAATYSGHVYRWNQEVGDKGWIAFPGDFVRAYRGRVVPRIKSDALVTVSRGEVYTLNPVWKTYSQVSSNNDAKVAIACDLNAGPGAEIVVACGADHQLYLCQNRKVDSLHQRAQVMTCGQLDGSESTLVVISPDGAICRYDRSNKSWKTLTDERAWSDLISWNVDRDGTEELYAVEASAPEMLYRYDLPSGKFCRVPQQLLDNAGQPSRVGIEHSEGAGVDANCENVALYSGERLACECKFFNTTHKPYVIRLFTPSGRNLLRDSPADHIHHHGLMFAIAVNGCDFWAEFPDQPQGKQELLELSPGNRPGTAGPTSVTATLSWRNAAGDELLREQRVIQTNAYEQATLITWTTVLSKCGDEEVTLEGSHYFGLGMRFVESMDQGGQFRFSPNHGESTLVRGDERVTQAAWAAYTAAVENGTEATAVLFSDPNNIRPMYAFTMGDGSPAFAFLSATLNLDREPYLWEGEEPITFKWGIALLDGKAPDEQIDRLYEYWRAENQ
jgi:hypothetical protein